MLILTILGAMEVSADGDIANWTIPRQNGKGHGRSNGSCRRRSSRRCGDGTLATRRGEPKIKRRCSLPLTGKAVVDLIITDLAVIACDKRHGGLRLIELAPDVTFEEVRAKDRSSDCQLSAATKTPGPHRLHSLLALIG